MRLRECLDLGWQAEALEVAQLHLWLRTRFTTLSITLAINTHEHLFSTLQHRQLELALYQLHRKFSLSSLVFFTVFSEQSSITAWLTSGLEKWFKRDFMFPRITSRKQIPTSAEIHIHLFRDSCWIWGRLLFRYFLDWINIFTASKTKQNLLAYLFTTFLWN